MTSQEIRIFGPPGCGKTTTLSGLIGTACRDYGSEAVLVSSFTKSAARELVSRQLPLNEEQVGTLHALCYRALDRPKLVAGDLLKDWNAQYPSRAFGGVQTDLDDPYGSLTGSGGTDGDHLLQELNRLRGLQVEDAAWPVRVQSFAQDWTDFKENTGTVDFTDLIDRCVRERAAIPHAAAALFLDEAQDFSPLELTLARHWGSQCERLYIVGDDDQCLYKFKGATPRAFLQPELPATQMRVLSQSYRVPKAVHEAACRWIAPVEERYPKDYHPRNFDGVVGSLNLTYQYPPTIKGHLDRWLEAGKRVAFLASCSFMLDPLKHQLRDWGYPFHNPYRRQRGDWNPLTGRAGTVSAGHRVLAYRQVAQTQRWWTYAELWLWAAALEVDRVFTHGAKTAMRRKADDEQTAKLDVTPQDLEGWFKSEAVADPVLAGDLTWMRGHLLKAHDKPMQYACAVLEQHGAEALTTDPRIILGTIHSVKGGEADVVVLFPDLSPAGYAEWTAPGESHDSVRRCFYVGMTRAKEELHWAQPTGLSIGGYL